MLFVSSSETIANQAWVVGFQSRNRDAFRFKSLTTNATVSPAILFQSRNRDAFRFKLTLALWRYTVDSVSISESRCFSFQVTAMCLAMSSSSSGFNLGIEMLFVSRTLDALREHELNTVSISESRCFSFQVNYVNPSTRHHLKFQSRNRDAFRFKAYNPFSSSTSLSCFNLGIEMLFVSS